MIDVLNELFMSNFNDFWLCLFFAFVSFLINVQQY